MKQISNHLIKAMKSQARAKVGNKRNNPGYRTPAVWRYQHSQVQFKPNKKS